MSDVVAVTGATGFIGRHLLDSLTHNNFKIKALTRKPQTTIGTIEWITGDLLNTDSLEELVRDADFIIHCAGQVRGNNYPGFETTNVVGTENLIQVIEKQNQSPRFLMISSLAAREPHLSWYAKSKYQSEQVLVKSRGNFKWSILRPTAVYGPGDKELMPLFKATTKGLLPMINTPESKFGLIYVDDLILAINNWIESKNVDGKIYELDDGSPGGYDQFKLKKIASHVWGKKVRIIPIPVMLVNGIANINLHLSRILDYLPMLTPGKVRELTHHDWVSTNSHFTDDTGWQPKTMLKDGLEKAILSDRL